MTVQNPKIKKGKIVAVSISEKKGTKKHNVKSATLKSDFGILGDAHAGEKLRQVSLLARESIEKMKAKGLAVGPGDFAENITTQDIDLLNLKIGIKLRLAQDIILEITQIGKVCHSKCNIYYQAGDCVMPKEGIFARVLKGGTVKVGDKVEVI